MPLEDLRQKLFGILFQGTLAPERKRTIMAEITPRWEWRAFGSRFGNAEAELAKLIPGGVQESDEIYLLSRAGDNVKVRDELMDIKVLKVVNGDGLEQWTPVMKAGFPLAAAEVKKVLESLSLIMPKMKRETYTLDAFIADFAAAVFAPSAIWAWAAI